MEEPPQLTLAGEAVAPAADECPRTRAVRDALPFAIALVPFALAAGAAGSANGLSSVETVFGAVALLAGASQIAAIQAIGAGASTFVAVAVVVLVNLRFVLYGAGVARWFVELPRRQRLLLAAPVVDQTFLLCQARFDSDRPVVWRRRYYLGVTATLAVPFVAIQLVGFHPGAVLPASLGLHLAAPLTFAGMLGKAAAGRGPVVAAVVAAIVVVVTSGPLGAGALPVAIAVGVWASLSREERS